MRSSINNKNTPLGCAALAFAVFALMLSIQKPSRINNIPIDRVVISAPLQIFLSGGDPFLAANFEAIRVAATWDGTPESNNIDAQFRLRAHGVVALLNPCHEDNYYQANALLAWSGAPADGNIILKKAMDCRTWDDIPAFFYGFNNYYFFKNNIEAQKSLKMATKRAPQKAIYKKLELIITANSLPNDYAALSFLRNELKSTTDLKLQKMLQKSVQRLEALIALKEAQKHYEEKFRKPLIDPFDLLKTNIILKFPDDPLGLGFEFDNGKFQLRELSIN